MPTTPQSPAQAKGSADGCESARADGGRPTYRIQDAARMASEPDYASGWQSGYQLCMLQQTNRRDEDD